MSIKSDLKKAGIEVTQELEDNIVKNISENILKKIIKTFPNLSFDYDNILNKLLKLKMYKAKMIDGMAEASYFYKNCSIYFNENISYEDLEEFAIHEYIHYLQEVKNSKNKLVHMGLCDYTKINPHGIGLNEAGVQYISSLIIGIKPDFEKYYNISLFTPSPSYYPIECSLLNEIVFFTGKDDLLKSIFYSTNDFKEKIITLTSNNIYNNIQENFDKILKYEENIIKINSKINLLNDGDSKYKKYFNKICQNKEKITKYYIDTQNLIIKNFFENEFKNINTLDKLNKFRKNLSDFSKLIGTIENYDFFDNYYIEMINKLEHKYNILENGGNETALLKEKNNFINKLFNKVLNSKVEKTN